jgi:hypothetical protein
LLLGLLVSACGGSGSSSSPNPPPTTSTDPCSAAALEEDQAGVPATDPDASRLLKTNVVDGSPRWRVLDALWTHRENTARRGQPEDDSRPRRGSSPSRSNADVGDIAVVQDEGDLILPPNPYDLKSLGLRFT